MDYYEILGVSKSASQEEIKKSFRRLAMVHHPDKGGKEENFKNIQKAYEVLGDPEKRREYDNPDPWKNARVYTGENFDPFGNSPFADMFNDVFGNVHRHSSQPQRNPDAVLDVNITLNQAYAGTDLILSTNFGTLNLNIPEGTADGTKFRLPNKGPVKFANQPPGTLIVRIHIECPPNYGVDGTTIYKRTSISCIDAMVGTKMHIKHIDNKIYLLDIPNGTQSGTKFRMRGLGLSNKTKGIQGDLYIIVDVYTANITDEKDIELLNKLKQRRKTYE